MLQMHLDIGTKFCASFIDLKTIKGKMRILMNHPQNSSVPSHRSSSATQSSVQVSKMILNERIWISNLHVVKYFMRRYIFFCMTAKITY